MSDCKDEVMMVHCHLLQQLAFSELHYFSWNIYPTKYHGLRQGFVHCLLNVIPLSFGRISSEDYELMQLKTVLESNPQM
jgi:hypothetical protein